VTGRHQLRGLADMFPRTTLRRALQRIERPILVVGNSNQSPYRRVLIPVDCTKGSAARVQFAAAFLPQARLHLLHACKRHFQDLVAPLSLAFVSKFAGPIGHPPEQALSCLIESLGLAERRPLVTIENGDPIALVKRELARQKTDLLILGTPARSGAGHGRLGSAAEAALRLSSCDILFLSFPGPSWRLPAERSPSIAQGGRPFTPQRGGSSPTASAFP
jgi:nucleotide-binding universal stress UspA family protein